MENKEDKILTEHMRDYLNHRGITPNKFAGELMLPNGKPMNMATIYRQLNGESVNLKEQTRFAIKNHKGLQEFIATKQSVQTIKDCAVLGSVKDGIVLPNNPNDPQTLSFESLTTSISYSFQPNRDSSIKTSLIGLERRPIST